jgi:hypothetical protein
MFMEILTCSNCNKEGILPFIFEFEYKRSYCTICLQSRNSDWRWYFCSLKCFLEWIEVNEVKEKGIPCRECRTTGYEGGYESNGECRICFGVGYLIEQVVDQKAAMKLDYGDNVRHCPECGSMVVVDSITGLLRCGSHLNHNIELQKECEKCGTESNDLKRTYDRNAGNWILMCPICRHK